MSTTISRISAILFALLLLSAVPAQAATPAFVAASSCAEVNTTGTITCGITLTAGDLLCITFNAAAASVPTITSVLWNTSEAMTLVKQQGNSNTFRSNWVYCLMGATSGAHDVVVIAACTCNVIVAKVFTYTNVNTGTPWDAGTTDGNSSTGSASPTTTLSGGESGDLVVTTLLAAEDYSTLTMTNGTKRSEQVTANASLFVIDQASSASNVQTNGTFGVSTAWTQVSFNVNASSSGGPPAGSLMLLGVGK